uniref:Uncharacterized protein n=1 Tax=Arundo donax TaxID=35708 RepID=A0A0A9DI40_ARUDO
MTLGKVVHQLPLARHRDQWPSASMPEFPVQRIARTP